MNSESFARTNKVGKKKINQEKQGLPPKWKHQSGNTKVETPKWKHQSGNTKVETPKWKRWNDLGNRGGSQAFFQTVPMKL